MTTHGDHHQGQHAASGHSHGAGLAETLTLDSLILGQYLEQATELAAGLVATVPATILDIGAGSGAGTVALAQRFENANIIALDKSAEMLAQTLQACRKQGLDGRVSCVLADLDGPWPAVPAADLIWASSSLHELADPEQAMREMFARLNPGGLLVVIEMDSLPRFLSAAMLEDGTGLSALEARLHGALEQRHWNSHPDWRAGLQRAGFDVLEQRTLPTVGRSTPELTSRYTRIFLGRIREALDGVASTTDLATLGRLLASDGPEALGQRTDLEARGNRTAWVARKPWAARATSYRATVSA
ncbi:trans-aconitate 2-methyltransferase [Arthrobacter alpinus]|uniref:class I SAM-dependent methyltransferase n=1 Tax=Arthrobacter alpinus TaxID=656366 RepID=UPI001644EA73|nr:class I SAM-dependent methyltransferase [Arthrobacter alpinus]